MSIEGIDISSWNPHIDWGRAAAGGVAFAAVKLTEGVGYVNALHAAQASGARAAGLVVAHYHYARPDESKPEDEAAYFLGALGQHTPGEPLALDLEVDAPGVDLNAWALTWLERVAAATGVKPLLYTYPNYEQRDLSAPELAEFPLWLASYDGDVTPLAPWQAVTVWQYAGDAAGVPGCGDPTDRDRFFGTLEDFKALGTPVVAATPPPAPNPGFPGARPDGTGPVLNGVDWGGTDIATVERVAVVVKNTKGVHYERVWRDYGLDPWRIV